MPSRRRLGTHPGKFDQVFSGFETNGTTTTFTHSQNAYIPGDIEAFYEWSPNLADWYAGDGADGPVGGSPHFPCHGSSTAR